MHIEAMDKIRERYKDFILTPEMTIQISEKSYRNLVEPNLGIIADMRRQGKTHAQIIKVLGITKDGYYDLKKIHPAVRDATKYGEMLLQDTLEGAMYKRALGYLQPITKKVVKKEGNVITETQEIETQKFIYSDMCLLNALKAIDPDKYQHYEKDNAGNVIALVEAVRGLSDEQMEEFVKELKKQ